MSIVTMKKVENKEARTHSLTAASPLSRTWSTIGLTRAKTEEKSMRGRAMRLRSSASLSSDNLYDFIITQSMNNDQSITTQTLILLLCALGLKMFGDVK